MEQKADDEQKKAERVRAKKLIRMEKIEEVGPWKTEEQVKAKVQQGNE